MSGDLPGIQSSYANLRNVVVAKQESLGVNKAGKYLVKGRVGDFKAHSRYKVILKSSMQAKRGVLSDIFFLPVNEKFGWGTNKK